MEKQILCKTKLRNKTKLTIFRLEQIESQIVAGIPLLKNYKRNEKKGKEYLINVEM